jgi:hypothetical protein
MPLGTIRCPYCGHEGVPFIKQEMSVAGWILFAVLVLSCVVLCWLPFVIDGCKEYVRYCSRCGIRLG